jgi:sugar transferase (PEP-CTERM/EpsH1 system associated)
MRILCLTSRLPYPPDRGDRLRAYHLLEHLSAEHELYLASFIAGESQREFVEPLRAFCSEVRVLPMSPWQSVLTVAANLWRPDPLQALYYWSAAMARLVEEVLASTPFDAAYVHLFRMAPYVADHPELYRIVDLTDVISREVGTSLPYRGPASRLLYSFEQPRIERFERWVADAFDETWLISEADRQLLAEACPAANIQVVPNGVDPDMLFPTGQPERANSLIFVGHLRVFHNVDAATYLVQQVMPLVREHVPDCTLEIVGADPDASVLRLENEPSVTVTGFVQDLNDHLNRASVFVAPLRFAAGVQNKVLEAMAAARPVVTTTIVNDGLGGQPGRDLLIGDDAESMAAQIIALLRDSNLRSRIGQAGCKFVSDNYSWTRAMDRMRAVELSRT